MASFPLTPGQVTKSWVAALLGAVGTNPIANLVLTNCGDEQGASAQVCRVDIAWIGEPQLPSSLIFKFASSKSEYREYAKTMGTYLKEVRFYQHFGANASLPIPKVYFADIDEQTGHFLLVMEDLAEARMSHWFADGVADVEVALAALAAIHAQYWSRPELDSLAWLGRCDAVGQSGQYQRLLEQILPAAKLKFSDLLSDYSWRVLDTWLTRWESVRLATSQGAKTLVHREADMRQMFFPTPALDRFVLFDWQSPEIGWGAMDACRMLVTSLATGERRVHEGPLIAGYMAVLRQSGVRNLSQETLWYQIKLSLLMNVLAHLFSLTWVEAQETDVWRHSHLGMLGEAIEDWQLLDVLEGLNESNLPR